jgi:hypothetical protein
MINKYFPKTSLIDECYRAKNVVQLRAVAASQRASRYYNANVAAAVNTRRRDCGGGCVLHNLLSPNGMTQRQ